MSANSKAGQTGRRPRLASGARGRRAGSLPGFLRLVALPGLLLLSSACNSTTVLLANFRDDAVGSPPASAQPTGTVSLDPGAGTIIVVPAPTQGLPANKWVRISHPTAPSQQTALRGDFSRFDGAGNYTLLTALFIPSGMGVVTLQFEPFGRPPTDYLNFLHLDFMPEGDIRVDDDERQRFGRFPRDQLFTVSVNLEITATSARAHVSLIGSGTSGSADVNINPSLLPIARQFGAVRFWMGYQFVGSFFVDHIIVTRRDS